MKAAHQHLFHEFLRGQAANFLKGRLHIGLNAQRFHAGVLEVAAQDAPALEAVAAGQAEGEHGSGQSLLVGAVHGAAQHIAVAQMDAVKVPHGHSGAAGQGKPVQCIVKLHLGSQPLSQNNFSTFSTPPVTAARPRNPPSAS